MNDDYLWDKSGRDPEIEAIEDLLAPLAHRESSVPPAMMPRRPAWGSLFAVLATAAAVLFVVRWALPSETPRKIPTPLPDPVQISAARTIDLGKYGSVNAHEGAVVHLIRESPDEIRLRLSRGTIDAPHHLRSETATLPGRDALHTLHRPRLSLHADRGSGREHIRPSGHRASGLR